MQQIINPTIKLHTIYRHQAAYINALVLTHGDNAYHLQGMTTDTIYIFTQGIALYALTVNHGRGYIGIHSFMAPESDPINTAFLHTPQEILDVLGAKWEKLSPVMIVKKLINNLI